jgi:hypothetical protein
MKDRGSPADPPSVDSMLATVRPKRRRTEQKQLAGANYSEQKIRIAVVHADVGYPRAARVAFASNCNVEAALL